MGRRGPVGKRAEEIMGHRTKAELAERDLVPAAAGSSTAPIPDPDPNWHPLAREWFVSLGESGQHRFFEPSDWATAAYVAEAMSRSLARDQIGAQMFAAIMSAASELLSTEGSRRRLRLELQRSPAADPIAELGVTAINDYRSRLGG